jgi:chromosome segregation ATPase
MFKNILTSRQPKQARKVHFVDSGSSSLSVATSVATEKLAKDVESKGVFKKRKIAAANTGKENRMKEVALAKGRSDIYTKLRRQIEILETDQEEAKQKIEQLEIEEKMLLDCSRELMEKMDKKFANVEEALKYDILRLKVEFNEQQMIVAEKNVELADKNDQLMSQAKEIEDLQEEIKRLNAKLTHAAKCLAW